MKKKTTIICISILFFAMSITATNASAASRGSFGYIGGDFGIAIGTGLDYYSDTEEGGSFTGWEAMVVWDTSSPVSGVGYESFFTKYKDNPAKADEARDNINMRVGKIVIPIGTRNESAFSYLALSYGSMTEKFEKTVYTQTFSNYAYTGTTIKYSVQEQNCSVVGIGIGYLTVPDTNSHISFGFGVDYYDKLNNKIDGTANGMFRIKFSAGFIF